jgi:Inhibitor of vertebrate lysozyme (Ivy)
MVVLSAAGASAWAQAKLDPHTMKAFGGTYMIDCSNNASPKATVFENALVFLQGDKRIAGSKVQSAASYYGANQPPEYRTVLMSEAPGGLLLFAMYQDKAGPYLKLDGDSKVIAAIGKPLTEHKFRRCDGAAKPVQTAAAPGSQQKYALHELDAGGVMLDPKAKSAYYNALGPLSREPWLAKLDGPSPQNKRVKVAGADYVLISACKNRDCADNNTVLLYSAAQDAIYGKVYQRGKSTLIGSPPPAVATELERIWRTEWRQGK